MLLLVKGLDALSSLHLTFIGSIFLSAALWRNKKKGHTISLLLTLHNDQLESLLNDISSGKGFIHDAFLESIPDFLKVIKWQGNFRPGNVYTCKVTSGVKFYAAMKHRWMMIK